MCYLQYLIKNLIFIQIVKIIIIIKFKKMNINDSKFNSLRRKLDQFGYTQTMHPDSVDLVDKLLKDQMKTMSELDKERKKKLSETPFDKNNTMVSALYDQIDKLSNEKNRLEKQIEQSKQGNSNREPDQRTLKLQTNVNDLRIRLEQAMKTFSSEKISLERQLQSMKIFNEQLKTQNQRLKNLSNNSLTKLQQQNQSISLLLQKKNKEIKQLEESSSKLRIKIQVLQKNIDDTRSSSRNAKEQNSNQSNRMITVLKQELIQSDSRFKQVKIELQDSHQEIDGLRKELRRAKDEIATLRLGQNNNKTIQTITRAGKEKFEAIIEQTREQLSERTEQNHKLKQQVIEYESRQDSLHNKIKQLTNKMKFLTEQNGDLQSEIQIISSKLTTNVKRIRQLEASSLSLEKQLKQTLEQGKSAKTEELIRIANQQKEKYQQLRKDNVMKERQFKMIEQELKICRQQAEQRVVQRDRAMIQNKKLQNIINEGGKNLQIIQLQKEELMRQNRELKTGKQQIASSDYAVKSQLFTMKQKLQSYELQLQDLRGAINTSQSTNAQLQGQIVRLQGILNQSQQKNHEIFEDNKMMVGQLKIMEQRKNQLHEKVRQLQERDYLQTDSRTVARKQFDEVLCRNKELEAIIAKKDQAIRIMDCEKDQLQNVLDQQTQEKTSIRNQLQLMKRESRKFQKNIDEREYNINQLERRLSRVQSERDDLDRQLHLQCQQSMDLKDRLAKAQISNKQMQNEVNNLTISNKQNQREVERARIRTSQLDRKLKDKIRDYQEQRQRAIAFNILNTELHGDIQHERSQLIRLQGIMRELEEANNHMYNLLEQKDQQLEHYSRLIQDMQRQEHKYNMEIESYQRQLQNISQDLEYAQNQLKQISGDRQALKAERNWKKEVSSQSQDLRSKQEMRYAQLQEDYNRKRSQIDQLRQRNRQLQTMLSQQRAKTFRMSRQLQGTQQTPSKTILVQSRVESYQSQNENNSNLHGRTRNNHSLQNVRDNLSERSQSQSVHSALQKIRQLQQVYLQTTRPNVRS